MEPTEVGVEEQPKELDVDQTKLFHNEEDGGLRQEYELRELPEQQTEGVEQEYRDLEWKERNCIVF